MATSKHGVTWAGKEHGAPDYEYLHGIPARDLSAEEYDDLTEEDRERVDSSSLYHAATVAEERTRVQAVADAADDADNATVDSGSHAPDDDPDAEPDPTPRRRTSSPAK